MAASRNRRRGRARLVILASIILFPGPLAVNAEESAVLELNPPKAVRGQNVIITIRTTIPWGDEVQIVRPTLTGSMVWWAHPYARPWGRLNQDGTISRLVEVRAAVRVDAPGFYSIDPFHIMTKDHEAVTEIVRFIGVGVDERDLPYPVFTQWRSPPKTLWQGQTVPLVLEARNLPFLALVDSVMLNQEPGGLLEDAPGFGRINTRPYGEDILYDMPMASWLWTLNEPGSFVFPGVRVMVHGLTRETRGFSVDVKPLPPQAQRYGAVGRFLLDVEWEDKQYRVGEVVSIRVRVEGEGNMSVLRTPTPRFPGAEMVSSDSSSFYLPGPLGYKGWREERFNYRIDTAGELKITIPKWTWFYPEDSGLLYDVEEQIHTIFAKEASGEAIFNAADMLLGAELFRYRAAVFHGRNFRWYLLALPGLLILAILYLRRRSRLRLLSSALILPLCLGAVNAEFTDAEMASKGKKYALEGEWEKAAEAYGGLAEKYGGLPGLLHDRALTAMEMGHPDAAITLMRRGLHLRPGNRRFTKTLEFIEHRLGLSDQTSVPLAWPPSLVFAAWLFSVNALFFSLARLLHRREAGEYIVLVSAIIFLALSTSALVYTSILWDKETAIVDADSQALRKIPGSLASEWIKLPAGSAVEVKAVENEDCLVRTGYGLEGWLPLGSIHLVGESFDGL